MRNQRGFSLVELLIVVAIIGVIAAIAVPGFLAARRASNEAAAIGDLRTIGSAEATYISQERKFGGFTNLTAATMLDVAWSDNCTRDSFVFQTPTIIGDSMFDFTTTPASNVQGTKSYAMTEDYVIRYTSGLVVLPSGSGTPVPQ